MKKTYNAPLTEVVRIKTEQMICQSLEVKGQSITDSNISDFTPAGKEEDSYYDSNLW